jgi:hypothetical protein
MAHLNNNAVRRFVILIMNVKYVDSTFLIYHAKKRLTNGVEITVNAIIEEKRHASI